MLHAGVEIRAVCDMSRAKFGPEGHAAVGNWLPLPNSAASNTAMQ